MCGRYTLTDPGDELIKHFHLPGLPIDYRPRYNIAPTQSVTAILNGDGRRAGFLRWGLIPSWAQDPAIGNRMINARAETIAEKPSFRNAFRRRRCLIPADGFYEWQQIDGRKQPVRIVREDGGVFAFAGLWESWRPRGGQMAASRKGPAKGRNKSRDSSRDETVSHEQPGAPEETGAEQINAPNETQAQPIGMSQQTGAQRIGVSSEMRTGPVDTSAAKTDDGDIVYTCTIITTDANDTLRPIHHRMPVIIPPESYDLWLDREIDDPEALLPLLRPRPNDEFRAYPVSTLVNNPHNEVPDCVKPLAD